MKTFLFYIILPLCFLYSCSKENTSVRKLSGTWELTSIEITTGEGWTEFPSFTGSINFNQAENYEYLFEMTYWLNADTTDIVGNGTFEITNNGENLTCFYETSDSTLFSCRILTLTSTDLQLEELLSNGYVRLYQFRKINE